MGSDAIVHSGISKLSTMSALDPICDFVGRAPYVCFTFNNRHSTIEGCADCRLYLEAYNESGPVRERSNLGSELNQRRVRLSLDSIAVFHIPRLKFTAL
jgi:hypothetical protein